MSAPCKTYLIEGGQMLALVKMHIEQVISTREAARALAVELGADRITTDILDGRLLGVQLQRGAVRHPDLKAPNSKGVCYPKKSTELAKRFLAQEGYDSPVAMISDALGVPLLLDYTTPTGSGCRRIGPMLRECGFLYLSKDGPYALWIPDVAAAVAAAYADGCTVDKAVKDFRVTMEGIREIENEEWQILALQYELDQKKKKGKPQ